MKTLPSVEGVRQAATRLANVIRRTPWEFNKRLSAMTDASVFIKREDLQQIRSFKIRGAYNKISSLTKAERTGGIVCASAGNHAQGFAFSCQKLQIHGDVYMPATTPQQKVSQVRMFGGEFIEIVLTGDTYDACQKHALKASKKQDKTFIHPFDDKKVIEGQATIAFEILEQSDVGIDVLFLPVGGGGVASGISSVFKELSPQTKIIGVEPKGAPSMSLSIENGTNTALKTVDKFVDGASVKKVGNLNFELCQKHLDGMALVHEGKICQTILDMYNKDAIVVEPAGAMTVAVLDQYQYEIAGKNVVCLLSGSNNDITRTEEIKERALLHAGMKHYFVVRFPQRAGALKDFIEKVLGPEDDITHFEYSKKQSRTDAPAVVGIELGQHNGLAPLMDKMKSFNFFGEYLNDKPDLFQFLI